MWYYKMGIIAKTMTGTRLKRIFFMLTNTVWHDTKKLGDVSPSVYQLSEKKGGYLKCTVLEN